MSADWFVSGSNPGSTMEDITLYRDREFDDKIHAIGKHFF